MARKERIEFRAEVERCFGFLVDECGLEPPLYSAATMLETMEYRGVGFGYRVSYDIWERYVGVGVSRQSSRGTEISADLEDLVVAAGLAPRQKVLTNARSAVLMRRSLENLAQWTREIHPTLVSAEGEAFLRRNS